MSNNINLSDWFYFKDNNLYWKQDHPKGHFKKDDPTSKNVNSTGYEVVNLFYKRFMKHRIIWELHFGSLKDGEFIDHKNGIRNDNRLANLRKCTRQQNNINKKVCKNNKLGIKGVYHRKDTNRYIAQIQWNGKNKKIGTYKTLEEAAYAYNQTAEWLHGEFFLNLNR